MNQALESMRADITAEVKLPKSGTLATLVLPRARDFFISGTIPLPVLEEIQTAAGEGKDAEEAGFDAETRKAIAAYNDWCVIESVTALDGEPVTLTADDLRYFEEDDLTEIVMYASRAIPLPGKD